MKSILAALAFCTVIVTGVIASNAPAFAYCATCPAPTCTTCQPQYATIEYEQVCTTCNPCDRGLFGIF